MCQYCDTVRQPPPSRGVEVDPWHLEKNNPGSGAKTTVHYGKTRAGFLEEVRSPPGQGDEAGEEDEDEPSDASDNTRSTSSSEGENSSLQSTASELAGEDRRVDGVRLGSSPLALHVTNGDVDFLAPRLGFRGLTTALGSASVEDKPPLLPARRSKIQIRFGIFGAIFPSLLRIVRK